jgi:hypothetical protein
MTLFLDAYSIWKSFNAYSFSFFLFSLYTCEQIGDDHLRAHEQIYPKDLYHRALEQL